MIWKYFFLFCGLLFHSFDNVFYCTKLKSFHKVQLSFFVIVVSYAYTKNSHQFWCHKAFGSMFAPKRFNFSSYSQAFDPLWINFCIWHKVKNSILLHVDIQSSQHHVLINLLSQLNSLSTLIKKKSTDQHSKVYFWTLLLIYISVFMPVLFCFVYSSFVEDFETRKCESSRFDLLYQGCFWLFKVCWDSIWFLAWLFLLCKNIYWYCGRQCTGFVDCFG